MNKLYPYKMASASGRELARSMDVRRIYPDRNYRPKRRHTIVNWGSTQLPSWHDQVGGWVNHPLAVQRACDKRLCSSRLQQSGVPYVEFTTDREQAQQWLDEGQAIIERHVLNGHSGSGIVLTTEGEVGEARMYTKYLGGRREYRLHVVGGSVVYIQQKKRKENARSMPTYSDVIRNHGTGWVYCADNITPLSEGAEDAAIRAVSSMNLHFGAVDLITRQGRVYVLEINTAPGLEGRSIEIYRDALQYLIDNTVNI